MLRVPTPHMADLAPVRDSDTPTLRHSDTPSPPQDTVCPPECNQPAPLYEEWRNGQKMPGYDQKGSSHALSDSSRGRRCDGFARRRIRHGSRRRREHDSDGRCVLCGADVRLPVCTRLSGLSHGTDIPELPAVTAGAADSGICGGAARAASTAVTACAAGRAYRVLAADPSGPLSILSDGTRRATFFQPDDEEWVLFVRKLTGQALPLPSPATEQATFTYLQSLGTARLEKILSYLIVPGVTLTGPLLGPPTISQATYTTANGQTLLIKSDFGVVTLVDNNPLTSDSGIVEAPMNQGNRQIAWSTAVLLPSKF